MDGCNQWSLAAVVSLGLTLLGSTALAQSQASTQNTSQSRVESGSQASFQASTQATTQSSSQASSQSFSFAQFPFIETFDVPSYTIGEIDNPSAVPRRPSQAVRSEGNERVADLAQPTAELRSSPVRPRVIEYSQQRNRSSGFARVIVR